MTLAHTSAHHDDQEATEFLKYSVPTSNPNSHLIFRDGERWLSRH
jgi:hypothetical protein